MAQRGEVHGVAFMALGSELTNDVVAGATTITVDNSVDFDEDGGTVSINGAEMDYDTVDHDAQIITLSVGLAAGASSGDRVDVISGGQVALDYIAFVSLGDGDEIEVAIPYAQRDLWPEGDYDEPVVVDLSDDLETILDVPGRTPLRDGSFIDPATVPSGFINDGEAPASSPTPTALGGIGVIHATWPAIINHDPVTYEVHISTVDGFAPSDLTIVGETDATLTTIKALTGGTPLAYGTPYFVRIVAKDVDGAAAPGAQASASLHQVDNTDISALYAYLGTVLADQIATGTLSAAMTVSGAVETAATGQRVVMDPQGLHLFTAADAPIVDLPTDATKHASFQGDADMNNLSVNGSLSIQAAGKIASGASLEMAGSAQAPGNAPTVTLDHELLTSYTVPPPSTASGSVTVLDVAYDQTHSYSYVLWKDASTNVYVSRCPLNGGAAIYTKLVGTSSGTGGMTALDYDPNGNVLYIISAVGGTTLTYYADMYLLAPADPPTDLTLGTLHAFSMGATGPRTMGFAIYNGVAYLGLVDNTTLKPSVRTYNITSGAASTLTFTAAAPWDTAALQSLGFAAGVFDFGDGIVRFMFGVQQGRCFYVSAGTTLTERSGDGFPAGFEGTVGSWDAILWTGTEFRQVDTSGALAYPANTTAVSVAHKRFTNNFWASGVTNQWWASYTWRDSDATGGTHETDQGPRAPFLMAARYRVRITTGTIPDFGGTDDPNAVSVYIGRGATDPGRTAMYQQGGTPADGVTTIQLTTVTFSGTNPPATNNFPGSSPGYFQSGTKRADGTPKIKMTGAGVANIDGLIPPGCVQMWAGGIAVAPTGWLLCDGSSLSTALYPDLFAAIGYAFGGSGASFSLPNFTDRFPRGSGGALAQGSQGGSFTKSLVAANLPPHSHANPAHRHGIAFQAVATTSAGGAQLRVTDINNQTGGGGTAYNGGLTISGDGATTSDNGPGSSSAIDITNPYTAIRFIIKV